MSGPFPSIGRIVTYHTNDGTDHLVPAIVTATVDTLPTTPGYVGALTDSWHVHLTAFSPTGAFELDDVGFDNGELHEPHAPGKWRWPVRA